MAWVRKEVEETLTGGAPALRTNAVPKRVNAAPTDPVAWLQRTFNAPGPSLQPQTASVVLDDGQTSGPMTLDSTHPDGRALTYTVAETGTAGGTLVIDGDTATYTPPPSWTGVTSYQDTFEATASDADDDFDIHGLPGLLSALSFGLIGATGHTTTSPLTANVSPPRPRIPTRIPTRILRARSRCRW